MKLIYLILLIFVSSCATSNYGDPTRPDIRQKQKRVQQENLQQYGRD